MRQLQTSLNPEECPSVEEETAPCTGPCLCEINGTVYHNGTTFRPPGDDCQICNCMENEAYCVPDPDQIQNGTWSTWAEWSLCTGDTNCRDYQRVRCRSCQKPKCGVAECQGPAVEVRPCNELPCCSVFKWSEWSTCDVTCGGNGRRTRHKIFPDDVTARDCSNTETEEVDLCGDCECADVKMTHWGEWSECATQERPSCGWGKKIRRRHGPTCDDVILTEELDCFIGPCDCEEGFEYSNHSDCERTCVQQYPEPSCKLSPQPGCVCREGTYFNGTQCVTQKQCNVCQYNNRNYPEGEEWDCGECSVCSCCRGQIVNKPKQCPNVSNCDLDTHRLVLTSDPCCPLECKPKKCELITEPPQILTIGNCNSTTPVAQQYCAGECGPSQHRVDYRMSSLGKKECRCCAARVLKHVVITLKCDDQTTGTHSIPILGACECDVTACQN